MRWTQATRAAFGIESLPRTLEEALEAMQQDQLGHGRAGRSMWPPTTSAGKRPGVGGVPDPPPPPPPPRVSSWEIEKYLVAY